MKTFLMTLVVVAVSISTAVAQDAADKLLQDGSQLLQQRKFAEAYKSFEKANKTRGEKCFKCFMNMAYTKMFMQDESGAMKLSSKALTLASDAHERADADGTRGEILLHFAGDNRKKLAQAEQAFRDASKEDSSAAIFHLKIGAALLRQSKDEEGKKELEAFLDQSPNSRDAETVRKWIADPRRARLNFAPDFIVTTLKGETFTLSQFAGKVVLIDFWGTWCPPCRESIPELQELFQRYPADKLVIISVSSDQEEPKWRKFVADHKMEWNQYIDLDKHVMELYNVHSFPTYVLIDREGIIRDRISGLNDRETLASRLKEPLKKVFAEEAATH